MRRLLKLPFDRRLIRSAAMLACMSLTIGLAGCGAMIADLPVVGLPADAPPRKPGPGFLPVNDLPGQRDSAKLETAEQIKIRADLAAARERQAAEAAAAVK